MRFDIVLNNLSGLAWTRREIALTSDGTPWRPLVHVEDIARAYLALVAAPREAVHDQAFNVGRTTENYRVREVAEIVAETVPGARVTFAPGASPDIRNYRVSCEKIARDVPAYRPTWTVRAGIEQLYQAYRTHELSAAEFLGSRFLRVNRVREHLTCGTLDEGLRWRKLAA
jgi:nucleoside-diphosphate-sugar epimerase